MQSSNLDPNISQNESSQDQPRSLRHSFIERLLADTRSTLIPPQLPIQNLHSRTTSRPSQNDNSAKSILKRTILQEHEGRVFYRTKDSFMMKGRMLNGIKKPLENQMAVLLKGINDRITKEIQKTQKSEKNLDLPILQRPDKSEGQIEVPSQEMKFKYSDIFSKLRQARDKKLAAEIKSPKTKVRRINDFVHTPQISSHSHKLPTSIPNISSHTISHDMPAKLSLVSVTDRPKQQHKTLILKKGYSSYDDQSRRFLDNYRKNMQKPFEVNLQKSKHLTAHAFLIIDINSLTPIAGRFVDKSIQIASISKVMTCYLALQICKKYNIDLESHQTRVSDKAADTPGTTAQLQSGDILTIYQLMLGLMLPSGNDASVALAQSLGKVIQRHKHKQTKRNFLQTFLTHMNLLSKQMNLQQTWNNSHGLSANPNFSTPIAIALLTAIAIRDPVFNKIVNTRRHQIEIKNDRYGLSRKVIWKNTNKLLQNGWQGVKTGTTDTAGHCLMSRKGNILIAVYNCQTLSRRFNECLFLYEHYKHLYQF